MTGKPVGVDLWALGRRSSDLHWPQLQALREEPEIDLRAVIAEANIDLAKYRALPLPLLTLALPIGKAKANFAWRLPGERRRLRRFASEEGRIVHIVLATPWDLFYLPIVKRAGAKILVTIHDATRHPGEESWLIQALSDKVIRLADHISVLSRHVANMVEAQWGGLKPVHIVSSGLATTGPLLPPRRFPAGRPLRLLFFGRIVHYKGLDILLDAIAQLRREGEQIQLTVAGAGDYAPYRERLAALDCVSVFDARVSDEDKDRFFVEHDVNMLPYREASQSSNALDGLQAAMPTIATRTGGLVEQLVDGGDTIFTPTISASDVADAIRRLRADPALFESLSEGAHASARKRMSMRPGSGWTALYRTIASS